MMSKILVLCAPLFLFNTILSMEDPSDVAAKALKLQIRTHPIRKELNDINKRLASLPPHLIDPKKKEAFKIHEEDIKTALDQVVEYCTAIRSINGSEESLAEAEKKFNKAKTELLHLQKSVKNTLECIKARL